MWERKLESTYADGYRGEDIFHARPDFRQALVLRGGAIAGLSLDVASIFGLGIGRGGTVLVGG